MKIIELDNKNYIPESFCYNGSIIRYKDKLLRATRVEPYSDPNNLSAVYIGELNEDYTPKDKLTKLNIPNPTTGKHKFEDPRLFIYLGRLFCSFINYRVGGVSNQGMLELTDNFQVKQVWYPKYGNNHNAALQEEEKSVMLSQGVWTLPRNLNTFPEKNWSFFEYDEDLCFIYTLNPLVIVQFDLETEECLPVTKGEVLPLKGHGFISGGTCPQKIGRSYKGFYHSFLLDEITTQRTYYFGYYELDELLRMRFISAPLYTAKAKGTRCMHKVIFPCGQIFDKNKIIVSCGYGDDYNWILEFDKKELLTFC